MSITATVRMYHVGELGDCFLLSFREDADECNVLIDCGSFRNSKKSVAKMKTIARHIAATLKGKPIDVVVGTHQHNDHLSGFVHAQAEFTDMVNQVWLSWLDNPSDSFARRIYNEQKSLIGEVGQIYQMAKQAKLAGDMYAVKDMLGFYSLSDTNDDPEIPAKGVEILKSIGKKPVAYLNPGDQPSLPHFNKEQVKVYVLGPPRKRDLLFDKDPKKDQSYDHALALAMAAGGAEKIKSAISNRISGHQSQDEKQFPFNQTFKKTAKQWNGEMRALYRHRNEVWRTIDNDWLQEANSLALYLDTYTNNSSLVLAFELVKSGKVLLFAADAQTGNWLSWHSIKWENAKSGFTTQSLLENTVLYKVGHHGSHNSTLKAGLEAMKHEELVAMIPVDKNDPNIKGSKPKPGAKTKTKNGKKKKPKKWKMPARNLFKRLKEKTGNRVLRMDEGFAAGCGLTDKNATWHKLPHKPKYDAKKLFIEYTVKG